MPTARQRQRILTPPRFSPRSLPGLQFWFTAQSILGLADAAAVAIWGDSSNNGYIATEATNRPAYKFNQIGGNKASVLFDGTNDRMGTPSVAHNIGTGNFTIYTVARSTNTNALYKCMVSSGVGGAQSGLYFKNTVPLYFLVSDRVFATVLANNTWYLLCLQRIGTTVSLYVNGVLDANSFTIATSIANAAWYLGNEDTGTAATFNGDLAESMLYNLGHTIDQRVKMEQYIRAQYAIF